MLCLIFDISPCCVLVYTIVIYLRLLYSCICNNVGLQNAASTGDTNEGSCQSEDESIGGGHLSDVQKVWLHIDE